MNGLGPFAFCIDQLLPCFTLEVPDCSLANSILEVCIYAKVADVLVIAFAMVDECIVSKTTIVSIVLLDLDVMDGSKLFKRDLCLNCFFQ